MKTVLIAIITVLISAPAMAQPWTYSEIDDRAADLVLLVEDPDGGGVNIDGSTIPAYHRIRFSDLLAGLVAFDDGVTRYVALLTIPDHTTRPTTITEAELLAGTVVEGQLVGAVFPALGEAAAFIVTVVPTEVGLPYFEIGQTNGGTALLNLMGPTPVDTIDVGTPAVSYEVYVSNNFIPAMFLADGWYAFFSPSALPPSVP